MMAYALREVTSASAATVRRCGGMTCPPGSCDHDDSIQRSATTTGPATAPRIVHEVLDSPGHPLDAGTRAHLEPRLGHDFGHVRVHTDTAAGASADAVRARAYTVGNRIAFAAGAYQPATHDGRRLIAHELAHTLQQHAAADSRLAAAPLEVGAMDDRAEREAEQVAATLDTGPAGESTALGSAGAHAGLSLRRQPDAGAGAVAAGVTGTTGGGATGPAAAPGPGGGGGAGAPSAGRRRPSCRPPSHCPADFCAPYASVADAEFTRFLLAEGILLGISGFVDSRVVPLWREHINGGGPPRDLSSTFGADFTASPTTADVTRRLAGAFIRTLQARPPRFARTETTITVPLRPRIAAQLDQLGRPGHRNRMNFNIPKDIAGNIAGDIANNQSACPVGAKPSPQDDQRTADGDALVTRNPNGSLTVAFNINYSVMDTVDLCPGDCGTSLEQLATVPISQWEATGISGDVPFTVNFPAPATTLTTRRRLVPPPPPGAAPSPAPAPGPAPTGASLEGPGPAGESPLPDAGILELSANVDVGESSGLESEDT